MKIGKMSYHDLEFEVFILRERTVDGQLQYLVAPFSGEGQMWTAAIGVAVTNGHNQENTQRLAINEKLMLIVSEIAEAMEGHRKNLQDAHLPEFKSVEVELADALIRIFDLSAVMGLRLGEAFVAKMAYNAVREDHTEAARRAEGGKKY